MNQYYQQLMPELVRFHGEITLDRLCHFGKKKEETMLTRGLFIKVTTLRVKCVLFLWIMVPDRCVSGSCEQSCTSYLEHYRDDCPDFVDNRIFYTSHKIENAMPYRAPRTVPWGLSIRRSSIPAAGLGVFADTFIRKHTWLGEYEGEFVPLNLSADSFKVAYSWTIRGKNGKPAYMVDGSDVRMSNWLRYMNCARNHLEENVQSAQCAGRMYYRTARDLYPGQELLIYYGNSYARLLNIDIQNYYSTKKGS